MAASSAAKSQVLQRHSATLADQLRSLALRRSASSWFFLRAAASAYSICSLRWRSKLITRSHAHRDFNMSQTAEILRALKRCLKVKGPTWRDVAEALDLSKPSIRRVEWHETGQ